MNYWEKFYQQEHTLEPTQFATWIAPSLEKYNQLFDAGCGNGRDSYYLSKFCDVVGIDRYTTPYSRPHAIFVRGNIENLKYKDNNYILYSRFLFHSIPYRKVLRIIKNKWDTIIAEFRLEGDKPIIFTNHKRYLINGDRLLKDLVNNGYNIKLFVSGRGLAKYKNEDPLVGRIVCQRKY